MTENKRFNIHLSEDAETMWVSDVKTHKEIDFGHFQNAKLLTNLLNSLNDENEQLKNDATVLICSNQEYRKENQRLKHTLEKKEELLRDVLKVNDNMVKKIRELEEDNLELKEAMKRMMGEMMSR